jgi:flagellar hook-associated protein 2
VKDASLARWQDKRLREDGSAVEKDPDMSSISSLTPSVSTSLNQPPLTLNGLVSGIDTSSVVKGLLAVEQAKIDANTQRQTTLQTQQTAYKQVEAKLLSLQKDVAQLSATTNSVFDARGAVSSDTSVVTAAAASAAAPGVYNLNVNNLAQAQQIATQGFDSATSAITQGQLQLQIGNGDPVTITVDSGNNSLNGLAAAINSANAGVSATVVNDGSSSQPYRLLLTADKTGIANAVNITNNLASSDGTATQPAFGTTVQAAQDASVTLGSGPGALTVTSPTNQINNLIGGVTLQLQGTTGKQATVTVTSDTSTAQKAIDTFVSDFNDLMSFIGQETSYDQQTGTAGPLLGEGGITAIQTQLRNLIQTVVAGANPHMNQLGALGISFDGSGQLQVDDTKVANALGGGIAGVTFNDIRTLFGMTGTSDNPGVQFIAGSNRTRPSTQPYQVNITQAAAQASLAAARALSDPVVIDATHNTFNLTLDGKSLSLTLPSGNYSPSALAQLLQSTINNQSDLGGRQISVGLQNGVLGSTLVLTSASLGSGSQITIGNGNANSRLRFSAAGGEGAKGLDVAGNFVVGGVTENATGFGQLLTGNDGNANTANLSVRVTLPASAIGTGVQANVTVSRGIASGLSSLLQGLTDPLTGRLKTIADSFDQRLTALNDQKTELTNAMNTKQKQLLTQFADMENTLAQLQVASNTLNSLSSSLLTPPSQQKSSSSSSNSSSSNG